MLSAIYRPYVLDVRYFTRYFVLSDETIQAGPTASSLYHQVSLYTTAIPQETSGDLTA